MATDIEKGSSYKKGRPPKQHPTSKMTGSDSRSCRRKALALLQFFELVFAVIAMMIGIHAYAKELPSGEVPIIIGGLTLLIVAIEIYLEHGEPKIFNHWITIGLDILLLLLWATWPLAELRNPKENPHYYQVFGWDIYYDHYISFILIILLSIIEVILLISHIGVRVHQMRCEKREKACLVNATHAQEVAGAQRRDLDVPAYGITAQPPRCPTPSQEGANTEPMTAHPPGHRLREFSPEGLYQRSLQMTEEDAGHSREKQQIASSRSQSSLAAARAPNDPPQKKADPTHKSIDTPQLTIKPINPTPEPPSTTSKPTPATASLLAAQELAEPLPKLNDPRPEPIDPTHRSVDPLREQAEPPQITIEQANPIAKPTQIVTPVTVQGGCGCVDGADEVEIEVIRNGKSPTFDNGIHPLRMNPYKTTRNSPLREVESASDDWTSCD